MKRKMLLLLTALAIIAESLSGCNTSSSGSKSDLILISGSNSNLSADNSSNTKIEHFGEYVPENGDFCVSKGQIVFLNGKIVCEKGGAIIIENGGELILNGKIELSGDLFVGGKITVCEKAEISGEGTLHIINSFDDINCMGTVTAKIDPPAVLPQCISN